MLNFVYIELVFCFTLYIFCEIKLGLTIPFLSESYGMGYKEVSLMSNLKVGTVFGSGKNQYRVTSISSSLIEVTRVIDEIPRPIPRIVIEKILEGIDKGKITLEQVLRKNVSEKESIFDIIGFKYDKFIMGYDSTIYKICAYCLDDNNSTKKVWGNYSSVESAELTVLPKPFLLLAGISGTGKTRFVKAQAARSNGWGSDDSQDIDNYKLVPVRPDWHEPSDLLGYVSRIDGTKYIPTGFLKFLIKAWEEVFSKSGSLNEIKEGTRPFWLCLDEMNLAPVEQYFADYLSILESRRWTEGKYFSLPIISEDLELAMEALGGKAEDDLWIAFINNGGIPLPPNLIVAGTVNMDETTHGFSRKVIDRALTLDFQEFFPNRYDEFFEPKTEPKLLGYSMLSHVSSPEDLHDVIADPNGDKSITFLTKINNVLKSTPFELAYRALNELLLSVKCFKPKNDPELFAVWDDFLMQKVLPRIEGDSEKLRIFEDNNTEGKELLSELSILIENEFKENLEYTEIEGTQKLQRRDLLSQRVGDSETPVMCIVKSLDKIHWMQKRLEQNQYTSFWA